jgi:4-amino-4-deoxy-L-arabinose transferase-like glycosyltransferase
MSRVARHYLIISLFVTAILINIVTLKNGHNWGGDFAQYILCAKNILEGKGYMQNVLFDPVDIYPPGFPLLLTPFIKIFGINFKWLKTLNIIFWYLSIFLIYRIVTRHTRNKEGAVAACMLLAFSFFFFIFKQNVLSEVPFLFFIVASFEYLDRWIELKGDENSKRRHILLALFFAFASGAFWIRTIGILLLITAFFYFQLITQNKRLALLSLFFILLNIMSQNLLIGIHPGEFTVIYHHFLIFIFQGLSHAYVALLGIIWVLCPPFSDFSHVLWVNVIAVLVTPIFLYLVCKRLIYGIKDKTLTFLDFFSITYFLLLILWTAISISPKAFARYDLPLLPFVLIQIGKLSEKIPKQSIKNPFVIICSLFLFINLTNVYLNWKFNDDVLMSNETTELVDWVKTNVAPEEHFMFKRPVVLNLLTGRVGTYFFFSKFEQKQLERIKNLDIKYLIVLKNTRLFFYFSKQPHFFSAVWENEAYQIFKVIDLAL